MKNFLSVLVSLLIISQVLFTVGYAAEYAYVYNLNESFDTNNVSTTPGTAANSWYITNADNVKYENGALHFTGPGSYNATALLNNQIPAKTVSYLEFDVKKTNECGFSICLIPAKNLKKASDGVTPRNVSENNYITIGMRNVNNTGAGLAMSPNLGYAKKAESTYESTSFVNANNQCCEIAADGKFHTVLLKLEPISATETTLTVSVDGGESFTAVSPIDFYTNDISAICIASNGHSSLESNLYFDNVKIHTDEKQLVSKNTDYIDEQFSTNVISATPGTAVNSWYTTNAEYVKYENGALHFTGPGSYNATALLNNQIPAKTVSYLEFDVKKTNECGFSICLIPAKNLKKASDGVTPRNVSENNYITIGMRNVNNTGAGLAMSPNLGYAKKADSAYESTSFVNANDQYCEIAADGKFHTVLLKLEPISATETTLTVSVDGGESFTAVSPIDFYTNDISAICIASNGHSSLESNLYFDNVKMYSIKDSSIETLSLNLDGGTVNAVIYGAKGNDKVFDVAAAVYAGGKTMKDAKVYRNQKLENNGMLNLSIEGLDTENGETVKVFLLDSIDNMIPLAKCFPLTIAE